MLLNELMFMEILISKLFLLIYNMGKEEQTCSALTSFLFNDNEITHNSL